jgi:alkylated DNA nucleotide flippase Atl1
MADTLAFANFLRSISDACLTLAIQLEENAAEVSIPAEDAELPQGRGRRQQQILTLAPLSEEAGLKTADIATLINYEVPNTHSTLQALERAGLVELVPRTSPQHWRLASRYRTTSAVFKRVASRIRRGEWASYGDISIAVRGDTAAARGVGRAAATDPTFPHPERLLMDDGTVNPKWHGSGGRGPDHCQRLLEEEGITFVDGHASSSQRVSWAVLAERDQTEAVTQ